VIATDRWRSEPPCVYPTAKAGHRPKRRVGVEYSLSTLEPVRPEAVSPERALYLPTFSHLVIINTTPLSLSLSLFLSLSRVPGANLRLGSACLPFTLILMLVVRPTPNLIGCPSQHRGNAGHGLSAVTVAKTITDGIWVKISLSGIKIALLQHAVYYQCRGRAIMRSTPSIYENCVKNILTIHETRHQLDFSFRLRVMVLYHGVCT
jgi:hypothetical protein